MTKTPRFGQSIPEGYITKKQASELLGVSSKTIERIGKASQQTECRIRWLMASNPGNRSITVYQKEDLLKYAAMPRTTVSHDEPKLDRELLFAHLDETFRTMNDLAHSAIGRGSRNLRLDLSAGRGDNRIRIAVEIGQAE